MFLPRLRLCVAVCAALLLSPLAGAQTAPPRWQADFDAFARADAERPVPRGGVLFVGSSSIRLWDGLEQQFDRFPVVVKRGFGGSTIGDCVDNVQRLVLRYAPKTVVIYAGENDLAAGATPDDVVASVRRFVEVVRGALPDAHIAYVSIKPSPLRASLLPAIRDANTAIHQYLAAVANAQFIDVHQAMLDATGAPRQELFVGDRLHLNAAGYALWGREIAARLP